MVGKRFGGIGLIAVATFISAQGMSHIAQKIDAPAFFAKSIQQAAYAKRLKELCFTGVTGCSGGVAGGTVGLMAASIFTFVPASYNVGQDKKKNDSFKLQLIGSGMSVGSTVGAFKVGGMMGLATWALITGTSYLMFQPQDSEQV